MWFRRTCERITWVLMIAALGAGIAYAGYIQRFESAESWYGAAPVAPRASAERPSVEPSPDAAQASAPAPTEVGAAGADFPTRKAVVRDGRQVGWADNARGGSVFFGGRSVGRGGDAYAGAIGGQDHRPSVVNGVSDIEYVDVLYGDTIGQGGSGARVFISPNTNTRGGFNATYGSYRHRTTRNNPAQVIYRRSR